MITQDPQITNSSLRLVCINEGVALGSGEPRPFGAGMGCAAEQNRNLTITSMRSNSAQASPSQVDGVTVIPTATAAPPRSDVELIEPAVVRRVVHDLNECTLKYLLDIRAAVEGDEKLRRQLRLPDPPYRGNEARHGP